MKQFLFILCIINTGLVYAQNPNFAWARQIGGVKIDYTSGIAVDAAGNLYTTGTFTGTLDFD